MTARQVTVVGIAGVPGAGKTTLARALTQALGDATLVSMDDYQRMTDLPIEALARWADEGADFDALPVPGLVEVLAALRRGESARDSSGRILALPARHVVFETHFGRAHRGTGGLIDHLVWLDTPPDVALARNLRGLLGALTESAFPGEDLRPGLRRIDAYLDAYLRLVGRLVRRQPERIRPDADMVIDAEGRIPEALAAIRRRFSL